MTLTVPCSDRDRVLERDRDRVRDRDRDRILESDRVLELDRVLERDRVLNLDLEITVMNNREMTVTVNVTVSFFTTDTITVNRKGKVANDFNLR